MSRVPSLNALSFPTLFIWLACLAFTACSSSDGDAPPTEEESENIKKRDGGWFRPKDAGRGKDAKAESTDDGDDEESDQDEPSDETSDDMEVDPEDDMEVDAGKDAGKDAQAKPPAADAGVDTKSDAGTPSTKDAGPVMSGETPSCDELTYEKFGQKFLETYCYECHSAKQGTPLGGVTLDTPAGVAKVTSNVKKMVIPRADGRMPAMPKGGNPALTDEERIKFGAWIDCGAK